MCVKGGEKSGAMEGAGIKEVKDMSIAERRARDVCGSSPLIVAR